MQECVGKPVSRVGIANAHWLSRGDAIGVSPYDIDEALAEQIERLVSTLGPRLLMDLCLVSSAQTFQTAAKVAQQAAELTRGAQTYQRLLLWRLLSYRNNVTAPAYRRGLRAAEHVRRRFGIKETDPRGATRVFEALNIDVGNKTNAIRIDDELAITGAVTRENLDMKLALLQTTEVKRRFAGARGIFSAWSAEQPNESRLLTSAVTRDQQANRAFAAELTAPLALIRSKARGGRLTQSAIFDLAADLEIGADVVSKQAANNGISVPLM